MFGLYQILQVKTITFKFSEDERERYKCKSHKCVGFGVDGEYLIFCRTETMEMRCTRVSPCPSNTGKELAFRIVFTSNCKRDFVFYPAELNCILHGILYVKGNLRNGNN